MARQSKPTQSEIDGVQYRKAKLWQIILYACNGLVGMSIYSLIGMASYSAGIGYGISTIVVGYILTATRILDGITDPLLAFLYDKVNTRFGKLRVLMTGGFAIEALALLCMFSFCSSKGFGWVMFTFLYVVYVIGYTITNMTAQTIPAIMTNDPKQRPAVGVWTTVFNYLVPMIMMMVLNMVLLPMFGGDYNQSFLSAAVFVTVAIGAVGTALVCIGVSEFDKPENFIGTGRKREPLKIRDMWNVLRYNHPLQCYIISGTSDKIASQTASQAIINTMLFGILIGDMGVSTILMVVTGTSSLIDKIVSSFGALIATGAVALIGYTSTLPQPTDASTPAVFWMTMAIKYGLPILGWACTLAAMRFCKLDKAEMVEVQKRIADKKAAARHEVIEENLK